MFLAARYDMQLAALLRASAAQVSAGIPPAMIAAGLEQQALRGRTRSFAQALVKEMSAGGRWSRAARRAALEPIFASALEAAESSGRVPETLDLLATHVERELRERHQLMRPFLYVGLCWVVVAGGFPAPLLLTGHVAAWAAVTLVLLALPFAGMALLDSRRRSAGALPGLRDVAMMRARARWCRAVAMLNATGLPLPATLRLAAESVALEPLTSAARRVVKTVDAGGTVLEGARREGLLTAEDGVMLFDAEITGRMDVAFDRAAAWMEDEAQRKVVNRTKLLAIGLLGALAAFVLVAMVWRFGSLVSEIKSVE